MQNYISYNYCALRLQRDRGVLPYSGQPTDGKLKLFRIRKERSHYVDKRVQVKRISDHLTERKRLH